MSKSKFVLDKLAKLFEQGLISYKDLNNEILNILKSKKDEIILKLELPTKDEFDILKKRVENLERANFTKKKKRVRQGSHAKTKKHEKTPAANLTRKNNF